VETSTARADFHRGGGILIEPTGFVTGTSPTYVGVVRQGSVSIRRIQYSGHGGYAGDNLIGEVSALAGSVYIRAVFTSATQITPGFSYDGFSWIDGAAYTLPFSAAYVGLAASEEGGGGVEASFAFFRIGTPSSPDLHGVPSGGGGGGGGVSINDRRYVIGPGETTIDEFSDTTVDPAWVRVDPTGAPPGNVAWKEDVGQLMAIHTTDQDNSGALHAILRPTESLAVGEAFYTAFTIYGHPTSNFVMGGLILADGATAGAGLQLVNLNYTEGGGNLNSDMRRFANFTSEQGTGSGTLIPGTGILNYSRIVRVTSDTYRIDTSPNGVGWVPGTAFQWGGAPTHVGFCNTNWGSSRAGVVTFEFLRRMQAIAPPP
ncbi:MAG: hypothetical protein M3Q75_04510, partial [Gemmatimonadota bacterium]|nr:hypothetical protein [Gemmatimonadota bacterium]